VIPVSIFLMMLMSGLAWSLLAMVFKATRGGPKVNLLPLSSSISLIFGLPALRNVQPGVRLWEPSAITSPSFGQKLSWGCRPSLSFGNGCTQMKSDRSQNHASAFNAGLGRKFAMRTYTLTTSVHSGKTSGAQPNFPMLRSRKSAKA